MNVYVRELSKELGSRGIYVDVFTRSQDPCVPHVNNGELAPGVRVIHVPAGPEQPMSTSHLYPYLDEYVDGILAFAEQENISYDLIHSHYWLSGWAAQRLRAIWGIPFLQMFHTLGHMKNRVALEESEKEPPLRLNTEAELVQAADGLIAATPAERIQLMWLYHADIDKIHVIPPGVDLQHFAPMPIFEARQQLGIPSREKMLLYVGRIEPLKGVDILIRAIARLKADHPDAVENIYLAIIGGSPPGEEQLEEDKEALRLQALSKKLGLTGLITFLGAKSQYTLPLYYAAADALVMPSHYESFGMVALEAMACATPVITSEVGGLAYLVQDGVTGFLVPTHDPDELAGKIWLLLDNAPLREEMAKAAHQHARSYSWQRVCDELVKVYRQFVPEPSL